MSTPFFSVLLPAYNAAEHIGNALGDLLKQSFRDIEIIVVDDGSSDGTADVVRRFNDRRIRLISLSTNQGLVGALNAGLSEAHGEWIARQDADDRCRRDRLDRQRNLIGKTPGAVLLYSRARLIDERGWWRGTMSPPLTDRELRWDLCFRNSVPHTSAVFPTALVRDELNGYAGDNVTADFDLWSRLLRNGVAVGDESSLVSYRNHAGSIMGKENAGTAKQSNAGVARILEENLQEWAGAGSEMAGRISAAWLDPSSVEWKEYFSFTEQLVTLRPTLSSALIAEEDYTLMHRAFGVSRECAVSMLKAMQSIAPKRYRALPQPRTLMIRMLNRF